MKGQIAEKWTIGGDKLTYTFNLRRNVLFHDGKPLTSADVLFSYNMMMSEKIPNAHKKVYYKDVLSVSAPDARSCAARIALADPVAGSSGMPAVGENMRAR